MFMHNLPLKEALGRKSGNCRAGWASAALAFLLTQGGMSHAQTPALVDPNLDVRPVVSGLITPTTMAFLGDGDFLVLEKNTGIVQRVTDGVIQSPPPLDLPVNAASERGLLGMTLHPDFPLNPGVYLYWTESSTGADTTATGETFLLGNRVDRFEWDGARLNYAYNIIQLRAIQEDEGQPARGNHNGGVIKFGPDGKLYIFIGDAGRRGQMQNLPDGPGPGGNGTDDQFGGPEPDNAHLTGVILRLNDDGSTPTDNPFYTAGAMRGGEAGANLQKVFAYGVRNGFGMDFDPVTHALWEAQNGDDTFSELNLVNPGANLGWIQSMGPIERVGEYKAIETSDGFLGLQQIRWSPTNLVDTPEGALLRLFMVYEGGDAFGAALTGEQEVPPVETEGSASAVFTVNGDGTLSYELRATGPIVGARQAHIHLGAQGQNGPVVAFLYGPTDGEDFEAGDLIASGALDDDAIIERGSFTPSVANLLERMRQGRTYVNVHTIAHPSGEARGHIFVTDRSPVSRFSNPELSWRYEVAPAAVGFVRGSALGAEYENDIIIGAARPNLLGGQLFRVELSEDRQSIAPSDPRLEDRVADNLAKYDITESESLLFGTGFGAGTDIKTGPNGNLYVVSLTQGVVYEIFRKTPPPPPGPGPGLVGGGARGGFDPRRSGPE
jgi:glucose/arabinose dehydrogenase